MKSFISTSGIIAFKIWLIVLGCNTIAGSFLLSNEASEFLMYAFFGALLGGAVSAPVFFILWITLCQLLKSRFSNGFIFGATLFTGVSLAFGAAFYFFSGNEFAFPGERSWLFYLGPISGAVAISLNYNSVRKACAARDTDRVLLENFATLQPAE